MRFKKSFIASLSGVCVQGVLGISLAYIGFGPWALVYSYLANIAVCAVVTWTLVIRNNKNFFQSLTAITHVVVIGHSLNNVDRIYFDEARSNVQLETKWIFYYHTDVNKKQIEEYVNYLEIGNYKMLRI